MLLPPSCCEGEHEDQLEEQLPQSADIGCHVLAYVAESAYLSPFLCWRLLAVSACSALSGVIYHHCELVTRAQHRHHFHVEEHAYSEVEKRGQRDQPSASSSV
jgi:hypothetical protein